MKRKFEATLSYHIELDQADVEETCNSAEAPALKSEMGAIRYLVAFQWSELVMRDVKPPSEEVHREVGFALLTWAEDHMSLEETEPDARRVNPDVTSAKRLFDVTFTHRIDLAQEEVDDEVNNAIDPEAATEQWAIRFLVASDWSFSVCDKIEAASEPASDNQMRFPLLSWAEDNMEIEEITEKAT